jgi:hypothetical protein
MRQVRIGTFPYQPIVDTAERVRQGLGTGSHVRAAIVIADAMRKSMFGVVPLISLSTAIVSAIPGAWAARRDPLVELRVP